jgi:hypothetical protein
MIGSYREDILDRSDTNWPAVKAAQPVFGKRCETCHTGGLKLPDSPSDDLGMPPWQSNFGDPRTRLSRHILYNLTRPEKSSLLLAPLAKEAGGYGICGAAGTTTTAVFAGTDDPDYRLLLDCVLAAQRALDGMKRFGMPGFLPGPEYVREMVRYGIFPRVPDTPVDVYAADRAYWESHWYRPAGP